MLRNALDHGIEARGARGDKPAQAAIELVFRDAGDAWQIAVRDDGRGIDVDQLKARVVGLGLIEPSATLSHDELCALIFARSERDLDQLAAAVARTIRRAWRGTGAAAPGISAAGRLNGPVGEAHEPAAMPRSKYKTRSWFTNHMLRVKHQPCLMRGVWGSCEGRVEADHAGRRGAGPKAHDSTCIPLCHCARAAGVEVPVDPAPVTEYPATAVDVARLVLAAIAAAPVVSGHLQEVVGGAVEPPLARRDQRGIHRRDQVGAGEREQPGAAQVVEQLGPLGILEVDAGNRAQEHLAITEVDAALARVGEDALGEVAQRVARVHE
jgi:hypothetical protein